MASAERLTAVEMEMDAREEVLCSASAYTKKYYLNPDYAGLPARVKDELQAACVIFTEKIGGIIALFFDAEGNLRIMTNAEEDDLMYDEIGSGLMVHQLQVEKRELFEQMEEYYRAFRSIPD